MLKQYKTQCQKISNSQISMQVLPVLGVSYAGDTEALSVAPSKANLDLIQSIRLSIGHVPTATLVFQDYSSTMGCTDRSCWTESQYRTILVDTTLC